MVRTRYWPFDARWAFFASLILVPGLVALAVWLYRPTGPLSTRLTFPTLLLAVLLGLLPVALVILAGVRSVEAAGVKVAFVAVRDVVNTGGAVPARSFITDKLRNQPISPALHDAALEDAEYTIIGSLKDAAGTDYVVADLQRGDAWWDTRLLVLVAGAARLESPKAVVFTSPTPDGPRGFVGWARPSELLGQLLATEPTLSEAYQEAQGDLVQQRLNAAQKQAPTRTGSVSPSRVTPKDGFEAELLLLTRVRRLEPPDTARRLTEVRVRELFGPILHWSR